MTGTSRRIFVLLIALILVLAVIDIPENYRLFGRVISPPVIDLRSWGIPLLKEFKTRLGLDLSGGMHVILEADMSGIQASDRVSALDSAKEIIERRVNLFGVSEPVVQSSRSENHYRIIVELPGIANVDQATSLIGQTAKLEFREFTNSTASISAAVTAQELFAMTKSVGITGKDLRRAQLAFDNTTGTPEVNIEFTPDGSKKFADVTSRLVGKQLAIFLDNGLLTAPTVQTAITGGSAVITGQFTRDTAKTLALQLNAGALPVPVTIVEKRTVGATLGNESVARSIRAGGIGLTLVAAFMIAQYGWLGLIADAALIVYGLATFAIFRWIPITLTLPGIAGFILSMGMAVDANILIFERYREEKRKGKPWQIAIEEAFGRAWDSIRDANVTTIITSIILFNPGNWQFLPSSGLVRGFAVTLLIGVIVSLFTGIVVTRTFIRVLYKEKQI
ncbi:protein translocase subunit SecD [Candidatus Gottesmanbacteria bacterium]|nr:protein translocase subunit SecD [Candidatus Gottesmanbacteria bacterium]